MLSKTPFSRDLAEKVTDYLQKHRSIFRCHAYYCGHGLCYFDQQFYLTHTDDAFRFMIENPSPSKRESIREALLERMIMSWPTRETFVEFLSQQSDYSMSGEDLTSGELYSLDLYYRNNQRITRNFLLDYIIEDNC